MIRSISEIVTERFDEIPKNYNDRFIHIIWDSTKFGRGNEVIGVYKNEEDAKSKKKSKEIILSRSNSDGFVQGEFVIIDFMIRDPQKYTMDDYVVYRVKSKSDMNMFKIRQVHHEKLGEEWKNVKIKIL